MEEMWNKEFYTDIKSITEPARITVLVNKFNQLENSYMPQDLEIIADYYNPEKLMLRHEARIAFEDMCYAADQEGLYLKAISTFRSFYYQWKVYLNNITPYIRIEDYMKIRDRISARPGHSEHQTGLAVDINDLEQSFEAEPEGKWLAANAYQFGFILRYPKGKETITGYDYEPWHFRYLGKELSKEVFYSDLTYDEFCLKYNYM